jgi:small-conductance mechanosensitive channel
VAQASVESSRGGETPMTLRTVVEAIVVLIIVIFAVRFFMKRG